MMFWLIPPLVSLLAYVGIDLGLSHIFPDDDVTFVSGMTSGDFFASYWLFLAIMVAIVLIGAWISNPVPGYPNNSSGRYLNVRNRR